MNNKMVSFLGGGFIASTSASNNYGCMDANYEEYVPWVNVQEPGSCITPCVFGCMDDNPIIPWLNYDPNATCHGNDASDNHVYNSGCIPHIGGCMDINALNYNPSATTPAGTCIPYIYGCTDNTAMNFDCATALHPITLFVGYGGTLAPVNGCVSQYGSGDFVNTDDGNCLPKVYGCMNPVSSNYNPMAGYPDGSCVMPPFACSTNVNPLTFLGSGGWDIPLVISNITDTSVDITWAPGGMATTYTGSTGDFGNYNVDSLDLEYKLTTSGTWTTLVYSVTFPYTVTGLTPSTNYDFRFVVNCTYTGSSPWSGTIPGYSGGWPSQITTNSLVIISGCTDPLALNYDPNANNDDGTCDYYGCLDPLATNYDPNATLYEPCCYNNTCPTPCCTYPAVYGCMDVNFLESSPGYSIDSQTGSGGNVATTPCNDQGTNQTGLWGACDQSPLYPAGGPNCCCETWVLYGCRDESASNYDILAQQDCDPINPQTNPGTGLLCVFCTYPPAVVNGCMVDTVSSTEGNPDVNGYCADGDGWPSYTTTTQASGPGGCTLANVDGYVHDNYMPQANNEPLNFCTTPIFGCDDPLACNYDPNVTVNPFQACDYSCDDPTGFNTSVGVDPLTQININFSAPLTQCTQNIIGRYKEVGTSSWIDLGAIFSGIQISSLTPSTTYEFSVQRVCTTNTSSWLTPVTRTTDTIVIWGCTDPLASNYDPAATDDDGSCSYIIIGCMDPTANNYDPNANQDSGQCEFWGCTDPTAMNYNPTANTDDGSCGFCPDLFSITGQTQIEGDVVSNTQPLHTTDGYLAYHSSYSSLSGTAIGLRVSLGNVFDVTAGDQYGFTGATGTNFSNLGIQRFSVMLSEGVVANPENAGYDNYMTGSPAEWPDGWIGVTGTDMFLTTYFSSQGNFSFGGAKGGTTYYMYIQTHCDPNNIPDQTTAAGILADSTLSTSPIQFTTPHVLGCTDPTALNYISTASQDDGSCTYQAGGCTSGDIITDITAIQNAVSYTDANAAAIGFWDWNSGIGPHGSYVLKGITPDYGANSGTNVSSVSIGAFDVFHQVDNSGNRKHPWNSSVNRRMWQTLDFTAGTTSYMIDVVSNQQTWLNPSVGGFIPPYSTTTPTQAQKQYGVNHWDVVLGTINTTFNLSNNHGSFPGENPADFDGDTVWKHGLGLGGITDPSFANTGQKLQQYGNGGNAVIWCGEADCGAGPGVYDSSAGYVLGATPACIGIYPYPVPCNNGITPDMAPVGVNPYKTLFGDYAGDGTYISTGAAIGDTCSILVDFDVSIGCHWGSFRVDDFYIKGHDPNQTPWNLGQFFIEFGVHAQAIGPSNIDVNQDPPTLTHVKPAAWNIIKDDLSNSPNLYDPAFQSAINGIHIGGTYTFNTKGGAPAGAFHEWGANKGGCPLKVTVAIPVDRVGGAGNFPGGVSGNNTQSGCNDIKNANTATELWNIITDDQKNFRFGLGASLRKHCWNTPGTTDISADQSSNPSTLWRKYRDFTV